MMRIYVLAFFTMVLLFAEFTIFIVNSYLFWYDK